MFFLFPHSQNVFLWEHWVEGFPDSSCMKFYCYLTSLSLLFLQWPLTFYSKQRGDKRERKYLDSTCSTDTTVAKCCPHVEPVRHNKNRALVLLSALIWRYILNNREIKPLFSDVVLFTWHNILIFMRVLVKLHIDTLKLWYKLVFFGGEHTALCMV